MTTWIALFRGINVGGRNKLPMAALRETLTGLGFEDVRTYIQSGNVVFRSKGTKASLARNIVDAVAKDFGFRPQLMLLHRDELVAVVEANPFPDAAETPKLLHVWFLSDRPSDPALGRLDEQCRGSERYQLIERAFYMHTPDGFGDSKLATNVEKCLGVPATARNWRTVCKLLEMAESVRSL